MDIGDLILDGPVQLNVKENGVATITLNRPDTLNSLNEETSDAFTRVLDEVERRSGITALVWTGAGVALSGGGDVNMLHSTVKISDARRLFERAYIQNRRFYNLPMPVIVAANGVIAGVATGRSLAADILIASDKARFAVNFINLGLLPDGGASYFLYQKLGHHRTAELIYTGKVLDAGQCLELGIFNMVVPHEELYPEVYLLADQLARGPVTALRYAKQILRACSSSDFNAIASLEAGAQVQCWASDDFREGVRAFLEKRLPRFSGK